MENILFIIMGTSRQELRYAKSVLKIPPQSIRLFLLIDKEHKKILEESSRDYCNLEFVIFITPPWDNRTIEQALMLSENVKKRHIFSVVATEYTTWRIGKQERIQKLLPFIDSVLFIPGIPPKQYNNKKYFLEKWIRKQNFYQKINQFLSFLNKQNNEKEIVMTDLKDICYIFRNSKEVFWYFGKADGRGRSERAAQMCIDSISSNILSAATKVMIHLYVSENVRLDELETACKIIEDALPPNVTIVFGATFLDCSIEGTIRIDVMIAI